MELAGRRSVINEAHPSRTKFEKGTQREFFPKPMSHATNKYKFFVIFFLSYWVTVTNRNLVCCTELLQQTKKLFVALRDCDKQNFYMLAKGRQKCWQCWTFWHFGPLFSTFPDFCALFWIFNEIFCFFLALFVNIY